ncbi:MAG TPA: BON domain-containing protein [Polyangiales bacterium]|nr:BON domain-containing protein [Polyangiales bacterium]
MGERDRYQSQYDRERAQHDYDESYREPSRESYRARVQPRPWEPQEEYRRDPRGRYAGYYQERQYGTRGLDEREQGTGFGGEEEHYRPRPSNDWGRPSRDDFSRNRFDYASNRDAYSSSRGDYSSERGSYSRDRDDYARQHNPQHHDEGVGHQLREVGHRIARTVKRAFRGPKGYKRSDERIREDISDRLGEHQELDCSDVEVNVINGEVTLTGTVATRREKFLIEEITDDVSGVNDVQNHVRVRREQSPRETQGPAAETTTSSEASRMRNLRS